MKVDEALLKTIIKYGDHEASSSESERKPALEPTLLEALLSRQGIFSVNKWFQTHATVVSIQVGSGSLRGGGARALPEWDYLSLMRRLTDLPEHELFDLYDLLDKNARGGIRCKEFILLLAVLASRSANQRLQLLFMHGRDMFDLITGCGCGWQGIRIWGVLFEVKDNVLWEIRVNLEVSLGPTLTFQDYQLLMFAAIRADKTADLLPPTANGSKKKSKKNEKDTSKSSASCTIT
mmetsp:Transcript_4910/g.8502  ORF Transcript_4910/g.8502 Transcript_4910/m.8502 type:complete len:235 (+) Transcript_4910:235-939(+)|eukprot:CAMPEP_0198220668 /NCGR_PEP_ID=MMETSP1445-20131203/80172_1 /TAXON_ID=36898 /ORGANISM="Pyramimonas sp., Strain CCMP2087" /LENGTH=234 /DNA_ID=CAMNT_0043898533 /DNA_START=145 /DNA_END=849 /DNA_ORIENTATION=-